MSFRCRTLEWIRNQFRGIRQSLLVEVRSVDGIVLEEHFYRVDHRVVEVLDGLVAPMSGPVQELFEH